MLVGFYEKLAFMIDDLDDVHHLLIVVFVVDWQLMGVGPEVLSQQYERQLGIVIVLLIDLGCAEHPEDLRVAQILENVK